MTQTKETIIAAFLITKLIIEAAKDGVQVTDALTLFAQLQEPVNKAKIDAALADIQKVPEEIKVATLADYIELTMVILPEIKSLVEGPKK